MINAQKTLEHLDIPCDCYAVSVVRTLIEDAPQPIKRASHLVQEITGIEKTFTSVIESIHFTQYVVETARKGEFEPEYVIQAAAECVKRMREKCPEAYLNEVNAPTVVDGVTQVVIKDDGSIKKGGKTIMAADLYRKHVLCDAPVTQQQFVQILMDEVQMPRAGANTYAYSTRKKLGGDYAKG